MPMSAEQWRASVGSNNAARCYLLRRRNKKSPESLLNQFLSLLMALLTQGAGSVSDRVEVICDIVTPIASCAYGLLKSCGSSKGNWRGCLQLLCVAFSIAVMAGLLHRSGDVETNPGPPEFALTADNLKEVRDLIWDANAEWYDLGLQLNLKVSELKVIKKDNDDVKSRFREMLLAWLKKADPPPSWQCLMSALEHKSVQCADLAKDIRERYDIPMKQISALGTKNVLSSGLSVSIESNAHTPTSSAVSPSDTTEKQTPPSDATERDTPTSSAVSPSDTTERQAPAVPPSDATERDTISSAAVSPSDTMERQTPAVPPSDATERDTLSSAAVSHSDATERQTPTAAEVPPSDAMERQTPTSTAVPPSDVMERQTPTAAEVPSDAMERQTPTSTAVPPSDATERHTPTSAVPPSDTTERDTPTSVQPENKSLPTDTESKEGVGDASSKKEGWSPEPLSRGTIMDLEYVLVEHHKKIVSRYASYVRFIRTSIEYQGISVTDLRSYLLSLDAFQLTGVEINKFERATTVGQIFDLLIECTPFFNYEIYQCMMEEYDIYRGQDVLRYPDHIKSHIERLKISEFIKINPRLEKCKDSSKKLTLMMDFGITCSIAELVEFKKAVAHIFKLMPSAVRLCNINGSELHAAVKEDFSLQSYGIKLNFAEKDVSEVIISVPMSDSPELKTLKKCTSQLETALKGCRRDLVHFLEIEGFISTSDHDEILNPRTTLSEAERAGELVKLIRKRVELDPASFQTLMQYFKLGGNLYQPIVVTLEAEYCNVKAALHSSSLPTSSQVIQPHTSHQQLESRAAALKERNHHREVYEAIIKDKKTLSIRLVRFISLGIPRSGKTTFWRRLTKEITKMEEHEPSTGVADEQRPVIIKKFKVDNAMVTSDEWAILDEGGYANILLQMFSKNAKLDADNFPVDLSPPASVPPPSVASDLPASISASAITSDTLADLSADISASVSNIDKSFASLFKKAMESNWDELKCDLEDLILLSSVDTGGHAEFLDMHAALINGPSFNLIFSRLTDKLGEPFKVYYTDEDHTSTEEEDSDSTLKEVMFQALSSMKCFGKSHCAGGTAAASAAKDTKDALMSQQFKVMFVGTYKDEVSDKEFDEKDAELRREVKGTDYYQDILYADYDKQLMLKVDNKDGGEAEIDHIRDILRGKMKTHFHESPIPASWFVLSLQIRDHEHSIMTLEHCEKLAKELNIRPDELQTALWFLHHGLGVLLYYPVGDLNGTIFCKVQAVYKSVTNLIKKTYKVGHLEHESSLGEFKNLGLFSLQEIVCAPDSSIPRLKLVQLLEHLKIITSAPPTLSCTGISNPYFMPCMLRCSREPINIPEGNPDPLMLRFKCGFTPIGLFPALITEIFSQMPQLNWKIVKEGPEHNKIFKNRVRFRVGIDFVYLKSHLRYFEIAIEQTPSENPMWPTESLCCHVRKVFEDALTANLSYDYQHAFWCSSCHGGKKHLAVLNDVNSTLLECLENPEKAEYLNKHQTPWFSTTEGVANTCSGEQSH